MALMRIQAHEELTMTHEETDTTAAETPKTLLDEIPDDELLSWDGSDEKAIVGPSPSPDTDRAGLIERLEDVADTPHMQMIGRHLILREASLALQSDQAEIERLREEVRATWAHLEERGAPLERFGWPYKEPTLPEAVSTFIDDLLARAEAAESTLQAKEAQIERMAEALKPFAEAHSRRPSINDTHPDYDLEFADDDAEITWGDLRRAAALANREDKGDGHE